MVMGRVAILLSCVLLFACERLELPSWESGNANLVLSVQVEGSTRSADGAAFDRLGIALFDATGSKVKSVSQTADDSGFGTVSMSLNAGIYTVVVIAHSCAGTATITSAEKVTFPNNKVTDTFYYYGSLTVTEGRKEEMLTLHRAVAMVRLSLSGLPDETASVRFYYLGGSSTFSPATGFGCVASKQTEVRQYAANGVYEIYTMPHSSEDVLTRLDVMALDSGDNEIASCTLSDIPVTVNRITLCDADMGASGGMGDVALGIRVNTEWEGEDRY